MGDCCQAGKPARTELFRDAIRATVGRAENTGDIAQSRIGDRSGSLGNVTPSCYPQTKFDALGKVVLGKAVVNASTLLARITNHAYMHHCKNGTKWKR